MLPWCLAAAYVTAGLQKLPKITKTHEVKKCGKNRVDFMNEFWFDHFLNEKRSQIYTFMRPKHYYRESSIKTVSIRTDF